MAMSKKHYVSIANALHQNYESADNAEDKLRVQLIAIDLGMVFEADNPRFNIHRFIDAVIEGDK